MAKHPATERTNLIGKGSETGAGDGDDPTLKWRILFYVNGEMRDEGLRKK